MARAIAGVLGMLAGAALYAEAYPWMKANVLGIGELGKETLVTATGLSPWWFLTALAVIAVLAFTAVERRETRRRATAWKIRARFEGGRQLDSEDSVKAASHCGAASSVSRGV